MDNNEFSLFAEMKNTSMADIIGILIGSVIGYAAMWFLFLLAGGKV